MKFSLQGLRHQQGQFSLELDLEVSGQVIGLYGGSGAGKTSLVEIVAGLRRPKAGRLTLDDRCLMDLARGFFQPPETRHIGYVPQDLALFPHLSIWENLAYGQKHISSDAAAHFEQVVEILDLSPHLDHMPGDLSGGQQQRVAFARAVLAQPQLLLLDEPLSSLDFDLKERLIPYLKKLRDQLKAPMLYVSHSPEEMVELCDQVIVLHQGRAVRCSSPADLFELTASLRPRADLLAPIPEDAAVPPESPAPAGGDIPRLL